MLLTYATSALLKIPGLRIIGTAKEKASAISFVMNGLRTEEIGDYLNRKGIAGLFARSEVRERSIESMRLRRVCRHRDGSIFLPASVARANGSMTGR
jgi:selenocysteine lyase/cysteine desulfurase